MKWVPVVLCSWLCYVGGKEGYTIFVANVFAILGAILGGGKNQDVPGVHAAKVAHGAQARPQCLLFLMPPFLYFCSSGGRAGALFWPLVLHCRVCAWLCLLAHNWAKGAQGVCMVQVPPQKSVAP